MESSPETQQVKFQLPISYDFNEPIFYVRECYPKYYDMIFNTLKRAKWISLTGTPGHSI